MRFDVITLFPELFAPFQSIGVTRRAFESKAVDVRLWQLRDFADDAYRRVDDRPYGGGPGMVMLVEPLERALQAIHADQAAQGGPRLPVVMFSPAGRPLTQARVQALADSPGAILLCGRYEGVDQRFVDAHVDEEVSLGDYVLSGGELPALTLMDAVARLRPGVLHDAASHQQDSFSDGLLDCPHYSRPEMLAAEADGEGRGVPAVLLSGNHARIARWRREQQLAITARRRPELIEAARARGALSKEDECFLKTLLL
ncbi:tRNA (guanosine(37)-N1)-methyltransferase TrmD [Aquabacterium sp.]|uniref:tRNA (guanosine(37)-N1)-methyltransferase TrmD n=1 Tax=Aquabacterium sp. TaxID=1872578 RepID=UPI0035AEEB02